jgi:PAS domain S-box-containing protein
MTNKLRVLLVDDSPDDEKLISRRLQQDGLEFEMERVDSAETLAAALADHRWDIILCDYRLPSFNAAAALAIARTRSPETPLIVLSGTVTEDMVVELLRKGAHDFIGKQNLSRLVPAIRREIEESAQHRARREVESALGRSEVRYRALFETNLAGIYCCTLEGRFLDCNEAMARIFGFETPSQMIGKTSRELGLAGPDSETLRRRLESEGRVRNFEARQFRRDGSMAWVLANVSLLDDDAEGKIVQGILMDVTERREAQETHAQTEKMMALGSLVAGVAHEVRNPLFAISATLDAFDLKFGDRAEYRPYAEALREQLARLSELMQDLLDYGRPPVLRPEVDSAETLLAQALAGCREVAARKKVELASNLAGRLPQIRVDRERMSRVLINLIENAVQHSAAGATVTVAARATGPAETPGLKVLVEDSGPGFRREDLPRIFEPFFTRRVGGTGLGLAIVRRVVEEHGGTVAASNRLDGGACVEIRLPGA